MEGIRCFKALLRGFRDLEDGSTTSTLDIPSEHIPDNPKQYRQEWVMVVHVEDWSAIMAGDIVKLQKEHFIAALENVIRIVKGEE